MDFSKARKYAFWLLSRKHYHSGVLCKKLMRKGCDQEVAEQVIYDCKRLGFLDDKDAILMELKKGWGPRAIEVRLGLQKEEVRKWVTRDVQKKKLEEIARRFDGREKAYRTLLRKGFDSDVIVEIFSLHEIT